MNCTAFNISSSIAHSSRSAMPMHRFPRHYKLSTYDLILASVKRTLLRITGSYCNFKMNSIRFTIKKEIVRLFLTFIKASLNVVFLGFLVVT